MTTRMYSAAEQRAHLQEFEAALAALVPVLTLYPQFASAQACYAAALAEARRLLAVGFEQADLSGLARAVSPLFWLHKDWLPPLDEVTPGRWMAPAWFTALEPLERRAVAAAERLRVVGRY